MGIARALSLQPQFIVCDEPVSSLDVSIQAQVLNLLKDLQAEFHLTYLFITHDLSVVKFFSDKIAVSNLGQWMETADSAELFRQPRIPIPRLCCLPSHPQQPAENAAGEAHRRASKPH